MSANLNSKLLNHKLLNHKLFNHAQVIESNVIESQVIECYWSQLGLRNFYASKNSYHWYRVPIWITSYIESQVILNHAQVIESQVVECYLSRLGLRKFVYGTSKNSLSQLISMSNSTPILFLIYNLNSHLLGDGNTINTLKREAD